MLKKDGTEEVFDPNKILEVCRKAGASEITSKQVLVHIVNNLINFKSSKIRRMVYKKLRKINKEAIDNYRKHYIKESF
ncbi:MAG: ATP cone domain-containing protein [Candidatus Hodarchaeota archaeon]